MLKKVLATSLIVSTLIFSGCDADSEGESRLETQNMLDKGDFTGVISRLEGGASSNEDLIALATAYMGKAGYSILGIARAMAEKEEDDPMKKLVGDDKPASSVSDLTKAAEYYKRVLDTNVTCDKQENKDNNITLDTAQKDICLFVGLSAFAKTATTLNLLASNLESFDFGADNDDSDETIIDYKLDASGCAMKFAFDNNLTSMTTQDCSITVNEEVAFSIVNRKFTPIVVHVNEDTNSSNLFHFMVTEEDNATNTRSTVLTKDYCTKDSFERFKEYNSKLYACPVNEDPEEVETTSVGVLTETINGDLDAILAMAPKQENDDSEKEDYGEADVNKFKCDVIDGTFNENTEVCTAPDENNVTQNVDFSNRNITEAEIIKYMNSRNKD